MNKTNRDLTREEIIEITKKIKGKPFGEFKGFKKNKNKGMIGVLVEEDGFKYEANSESEPDFPKAGLELKVTPYKRLKNNLYSAKERLVLNMINFNKESDVFEESSFWKKNKELLILFYEHLENNDKSKFSINYFKEFSFPEKDLIIIKQDWEKIRNKIEIGKAHEISEGDTLYLGACTKAKDSTVKTTQPNSSILAKPRAYSLKTTYMTQLVRQIISCETSKLEKIADSLLVDYQNFEESLVARIGKYYGKGQKELSEKFELNIEAKHVNELIISKILGLKGKISRTDEFLKANIIVKTIRVEKNNSIKESMSFPTFKYTEIVNQDWEDSDLYEMLYSAKFLFVIFKNNGSDYILIKSMFWNMPESNIENQAKEVWETTKNLVKNGLIIKEQKRNKDYTYFPDTRFNGYLHVRPHGKNKNDVYKLPVPDKLTGKKEHLKHCFWFNSRYIKEVIGIK